MNLVHYSPQALIAISITDGHERRSSAKSRRMNSQSVVMAAIDKRRNTSNWRGARLRESLRPGSQRECQVIASVDWVASHIRPFPGPSAETGVYCADGQAPIKSVKPSARFVKQAAEKPILGLPGFCRLTSPHARLCLAWIRTLTRKSSCWHCRVDSGRKTCPGPRSSSRWWWSGSAQRKRVIAHACGSATLVDNNVNIPAHAGQVF